jgi:equilibrative nucleoside transporter 1/2/3
MKVTPSSIRQSTSASWIFATAVLLSILTALLALSTFLHLPAEISFAFILLNGITQAAAGSYLQTAVVVVASLFGPSAMQVVISGQAAVAVVVSGVQVVAAAASLWGVPEESISTFKISNDAEARSAFIFFALSTMFLVATTWATKWFVASPAYRAVVATSEPKSALSYDDGDPEERRGLMSLGGNDSSEKRRRILRVAKANIIYEIAVALDFIITLVRLFY